MNIHTNRLLIRSLNIEDLTDFHQYRSNPEVTKYQGFDVMDLAEAKEFILGNAEKSFGKPGEWVQWAIADKETNQLLGDCAIKLQLNDSRIAEIGITVSDKHQRQGLAKEAMKGIMKFLFGDCGVLRIVAILSVENIASVHVLESLGFRKEGHFIENIFFKGKWDSEYQYAFLYREWLAQNENDSK